MLDQPTGKSKHRNFIVKDRRKVFRSACSSRLIVHGVMHKNKSNVEHVQAVGSGCFPVGQSCFASMVQQA